MGRAALLGLILAIAACSSSKPTVVVGSKNFTEQVILGEIIAAQIERRLHIDVDRKLNLGGTLLAHEALKSGAIDLYPEYTGTALTEILHLPIEKDPKQVLEKVRHGYEASHVQWLAPFGFNDTFAMVMLAKTAQENRVRTLSDAATHPWRLGVGYEFTQRPDGLTGLVQTYGLKIEGEPVGSAKYIGQSPLAVEGWPLFCAIAWAPNSAGTSAMAATDERRRSRDLDMYFPLLPKRE